MPLKTTFYSKVFIEPGAYTVVDFSKFQNIPITSLFPVVLLGAAETGEPWTPYVFSNSIDIKSVFDENSYFYKVADIVFSPSVEPGNPSPGQVVCIKINDSTPGSGTVYGTNTEDIIYNVYAKQHSRKSIKLTYTLSDSELTFRILSPDGSSENFSITGARISGDADYILTDSEKITVVKGENSGDFAYAVYPTIQQLINAVNQSDLGVTLVDLKGEPLYPSARLAANYSGAAPHSLIYDALEKINSESALIKLELVNNNHTYLTGGTKSIFLTGTIGSNIDLSSSEFQEKLNKVLMQLPSGIIVLLSEPTTGGENLGEGLVATNKDAFILWLKSYFDKTNSVEGDTPFMAVLNLDKPDYASLKSFVRSLQTPYFIVCIQDIKIGSEWKSALYQAVQVAGLLAGLPLGTNLTGKKMACSDIRFPTKYALDITKKSDREKLILDGILYYWLDKRSGQIEIRKGSTVYTASDNDGYTDPALVLLGLYLQQDFSNMMDTFIGHDISASPIPGRIQPVVNETTLKDAALQKFEQWKQRGYIVDSLKKPAYSNVVVQISGKIARITADLILVTGVEWIFTVLYAIPYQS